MLGQPQQDPRPASLSKSVGGGNNRKFDFPLPFILFGPLKNWVAATVFQEGGLSPVIQMLVSPENTL